MEEFQIYKKNIASEQQFPGFQGKCIRVFKARSIMASSPFLVVVLRFFFLFESCLKKKDKKTLLVF